MIKKSSAEGCRVGQQMKKEVSMERRICVKGTGKVSLRADRVRVRMEIAAKTTEYAEAYQKSAEQALEVKEAFAGLGFAGEELKTSSYWVNPEYESYQDEGFQWKQRFVGYTAMQVMTVEFDRDPELLGKVVLAVSRLSSGPSFSIDYTVKDVEGAKNAMLRGAVEDSRRKAELLAEAAGVSLGELVTIEYNWSDMVFSVRPMNEMMLKSASRSAEESVSDFAAQIEPEEIRAEDTVTVVWEIR